MLDMALCSENILWADCYEDEGEMLYNKTVPIEESALRSSMHRIHSKPHRDGSCGTTEISKRTSRA